MVKNPFITTALVVAAANRTAAGLSLEICYVNISLITDYDVGIEGVPPVSHEEVMKVFASNNERVKQAIFKIIEAIPSKRGCGCGSALAGARF